ncbi:MAG TPA: hypothetical protein VH796_16475 [Nitrososphaeraceae archaeon]
MNSVLSQWFLIAGLFVCSVSLWSFTNFGSDPNIEKERIPNFAFEFLYEVARHVPDTEVNPLLDKDKQYSGSLLDCIIKKTDYSALYPSRKYYNEGASHRLFILYQSIVMGHSISSLRTAYRIAEYVREHLDNDASDILGTDLDKSGNRSGGKRVRLKQLMVRMASKRRLSLDEYFDLFIIGADNGHPWRLVKYYLLTDDADISYIANSKLSSRNGAAALDVNQSQGQGYKTRIVMIGNAIRDSYIARTSSKRFGRDVLDGLAREQINERWLWNQFQILAEEAEPYGSFDPQSTWRALAAGDNIHELLYLLQIFWTTTPTSGSVGIYKEIA